MSASVFSRRGAGGLLAGFATTCAAGAWAAEAETAQAQKLPWMPVDGWGPGAARRTLMPATAEGCGTFVLRLDPASAFSGFPVAGRALELLVVEGALTINGIDCPRQTYIRIADPRSIREIGSVPGAAVIVLTSPAFAGADQPPRSTWDMPWEFAVDFPWPLAPPPPIDSPAQPGRPIEPDRPSTFWKPLSATEGRRTLLWASMPHQVDADARPLRAVGDVEILLLQGDLAAGEAGDWRPGAHAFLPRGASSSTWSTAFGFVALVRLHRSGGIGRVETSRRRKARAATYPAWWAMSREG